MTLPIDRDCDTPLYRQIESWFRNAIEDGTLPPGTRLPALRTLAKELGLSRTTIDAAYAGLIACGLLETRGSGGTVVSHPAYRAEDYPRSAPEPLRPAGFADQPAHPRRRRDVAEEAVIDFSGGGGDESLFPASAFMRMLRRTTGETPTHFLARPDPRGEPDLRRAISQVSASQGLRLSPEELLITGGAQHAVFLAARALAAEGEAGCDARRLEAERP